MRDFLINQINNFLDAHESAASAHFLVHASMFENGDVEQFYEESEGWNDEHRHRLLKDASDFQLMEISASVIDVCLEKLDELAPEDD